MITYEDVIKDEEINTLIKFADKQLLEIGYTEHGYRHLGIVTNILTQILTEFGYDERTIELGKIAAFMHDIGNAVNRVDHAHSGAILAYDLLTKKGMPPEEAAQIMMAIGNHDEETGSPVSPISAALIIADKSDVHRSRVRLDDKEFDIHDRVNYAVEQAEFCIDKENRHVTLKLKIDTSICAVMKYFEIFLTRMVFTKQAAHYMDLMFGLEINGAIIL